MKIRQHITAFVVANYTSSEKEKKSCKNKNKNSHKIKEPLFVPADDIKEQSSVNNMMVGCKRKEDVTARLRRTIDSFSPRREELKVWYSTKLSTHILKLLYLVVILYQVLLFAYIVPNNTIKRYHNHSMISIIVQYLYMGYLNTEAKLVWSFNLGARMSRVSRV